MRIKEVRYQRVVNLGNYETERAEFVAELNENEDPFLVAAKLRDDVEEFLGLHDDNSDTESY